MDNKSMCENRQFLESECNGLFDVMLRNLGIVYLVAT